LEDFFRQRMDGLLITASWSLDLQQAAGLRAASQIFQDRPAWYIWLDNSRSAYALAWAGPAEQDGPGLPPAGIFFLKFYPHPASRRLTGFSPEERELVGSDLFDHTGTPVYEALKRIPEGLFCVAGISVTLDPQGSWAIITLEGQESLRQVAGHDLDMPFTVLPGSARFSAGQAIRQVPSWELGWPIFNALACLQAFQGRQAPAALKLSAGPGFEHVLDGDRVDCRSTTDLRDLSCSLLLATDCSNCRQAGLARMEQEAAQSGRRVIAQLEFPSGGLPLEVEQPPEIQLNPHWWSLGRAHFHSHLATACGCSGH
jgi:hypothetical protein